ncbi:MAG: tetratricopeptide repeat protein, partial [Thiotrichaceae bacterium]|nr:tetratricopeptide repeat protein [Thiotrichaceae bacterium]
MINKKLHKQGKILILLLSISVLFSCSIIKLENKQKQQVPDKVQQAENLLARGVASYRQYNYTQAGAFFNKALYAYRSIDNPQGIILSLSNLAKTSLALGNVPLAVKYLTKAKNIIATAEKPFNNKIINHLIIVESSIKIEKKEYNSAIKILQPLLETSHSPDSELRIAALQNRVRIAIAQHDPHTAQWLQQFSQSISNSQQNNYSARLLRFKAALSHNSDEQNTYYHQALKIYRDNANQVGIAATLEEWSQQQYQLKQYHAATDK